MPSRLQQIREAWEKEHPLILDTEFTRIVTDDELLDLQRRSYDAGYQAGLEAAKAALPSNWTDAILSGDDVPKLPWGCPQIEWFIRRLGEWLDALKAVDRG